MKKLLSCINWIVCLVFCVCILGCVGIVHANTAVEIYTVEQFYNIRNDLSADYVLMNDLDLTEETTSGGTYDDYGWGWDPFGSNGTYGLNSPFSGTFDGKNHTITGLKIQLNATPTTSDENIYVGLFTNVTGTIKNLNIVNCNISAENVKKIVYVGALAGKCSGSITNCSVNGSVYGKSTYSKYTRKQGYYHSVSSTSYVGGLFGLLENGMIKYCKNNADILSECESYSSEPKYATYIEAPSAGGIAGKGISSNIYNTENHGNVANKVAHEISSGYVSGISSGAAIANCYNTGDLLFEPSTALVSYGIGWTVTTCYSVGTVSKAEKCLGTGNSPVYSYFLEGQGGFAGGGIPLTRDELLQEDNYVGFDFERVWYIDSEGSYKYPQLYKELDSVEVKSYPGKTSYMTDDDIDPSGGVLTIYYADDTSEDLTITTDMLSGYDLSALGNYDVKIRYRGEEFSYPITVRQRPPIENMTILTPPDKTEFVVNTSFDFTGAVARVNYEDGTYEDFDITVSNSSGGDITETGTYTIHFEKFEHEVTFNVTVIPVMEQEIKIVSLPDKLEYIEGQDIDFSGLEIDLIYNNGNREAVTDYTVAPYSKEVGNQTVSLSYHNLTATFDVVFVEKTLQSIRIAEKPDKQNYIYGQTFDPTGMVVEAIYDNQDVEIVEDYIVSNILEIYGNQDLTVSYLNKTTFLTITVARKQLVRIQVTQNPAKMNYIAGEDFDPTGMVVTGYYNDETTSTVENYSTSLLSEKIGNQTVTISYQGKTTSVTVYVKAATVIRLTASEPDKVDYISGESFNPAGMIVTAYYDSGKSSVISDYTVEGFGETNEENIVTIVFNGITTSITVFIHEEEDLWVVEREATCTAKGLKKLYCKNCGKELKSKVTAPLGHTLVVDVPLQEATCTSTGWTEKKHCTVCGEVIERQVIQKLPHTKVVTKSAVTATCTRAGNTREISCSVCGTIITASTEIPALGHDVVIDPAVEATCTSTGLTEGSHCSRCNQVLISQVQTEKKPHAIVVDVPEKPATCTENGSKELSHCKNCNTILSDGAIIPAGHTIVIDKAVPATESEFGLSEGSHCSVCGVVIKEQARIEPLLDSSYDGWIFNLDDWKSLAGLSGTKKYKLGLDINVGNYRLEIPSDLQLTLDLNNHSIIKSDAIGLINNGTLIIDDTSTRGKGRISVDIISEISTTAVIANKGSLYLKNGVLETMVDANNYALVEDIIIVNNQDYFQMQGGTITVSSKHNVSAGATTTIAAVYNRSGGRFDINGGSIEIDSSMYIQSVKAKSLVAIYGIMNEANSVSTIKNHDIKIISNSNTGAGELFLSIIGVCNKTNGKISLNNTNIEIDAKGDANKDDANGIMGIDNHNNGEIDCLSTSICIKGSIFPNCFYVGVSNDSEGSKLIMSKSDTPKHNNITITQDTTMAFGIDGKGITEVYDVSINASNGIINAGSLIMGNLSDGIDNSIIIIFAGRKLINTANNVVINEGTYTGGFGDGISRISFPAGYQLSGLRGNNVDNGTIKPIEYSINYQLGGGINNNRNPSKYTIESSDVLLKDPIRTGYVFEGWFEDAAFTKKVQTISHTTLKNYILYAKWSVEEKTTNSFQTKEPPQIKESLQTKEKYSNSIQALDCPIDPAIAPSLKEKEKEILNSKKDEAPAGSVFNLLQLRATKITKNSIKVQWTKVKGAKGYVIYGAKCGQKYKKLKSINKGNTQSWTQKKREKGKYYKYYIIAIAKYQGKDKVIASSKTIHVATSGGKVGNFKAVKLTNPKKAKVTLQVEKKFQIKAKAVAASAKLKTKNHRKLSYESTNPDVAKVSSKGKITAKKAGTCYVYVYAQNGVFKKIKVTVK